MMGTYCERRRLVTKWRLIVERRSASFLKIAASSNDQRAGVASPIECVAQGRFGVKILSLPFRDSSFNGMASRVAYMSHYAMRGGRWRSPMRRFRYDFLI